MELTRRDDIRRKLFLDIEPWNNIPNEVIAAVFIHNSNLQKEISEKYQIPRINIFEFLGDAILDLIVVKHLVNIGITDSAAATRYRDSIVKNQTLVCLMNSKRLCNDVVGHNVKACANTFEMIIGLLYWWSENKIGYNNPLNLVGIWLNQVWQFDKIIQHLVSTGVVICNILEITDQDLTRRTKMLPLASMSNAESAIYRGIDFYRDLLMDENNASTITWDDALLLAYQQKILEIKNVTELRMYPALHRVLSTLAGQLLNGNNVRQAKHTFSTRIFPSIPDPSREQMASFAGYLRQIIKPNYRLVNDDVSNMLILGNNFGAIKTGNLKPDFRNPKTFVASIVDTYDKIRS